MTKHRGQFRRRQRSYMERRVDSVSTRQRFLIVCEGTETEPKYFKSFRVPSKVIQAEGTGMNTVSLVEEAVRLREDREREDGKYDQVWCVFDKDDFSSDQFEQAIQLAHKNGIRVAYSNQAFELWYVLHFCYMQNAIGRNDYRKMLDKFLGFKYEKNNPEMYKILLPSIDIAIENAQKLLGEYNPSRPGQDDPSTRVHELVIELRDQAKPLA